MKVVFISNFYNHHQKPFSDKIFSALGNNYYFIETEKIPEERKNMGYGMETFPEYVVTADKDKNNAVIQKLIEDADVLIVGSAPEKYVTDRVRKNKMVIRYSERPLRNGLELWKFPGRLLKWHKNNPQSKEIFLLCASAYTIGDYRKFGLFKNKAFKWGYFTETKKYEKVEEILSQKSKSTILWAGRFLKLKHVDDIIAVSKRLKDEGYDFIVELIGNGEMLPELQKKVAENQLNDTVQFLGAMKPEQVREHMEKAGIYLFTSDKREGWGAVLNESMNSGCAVVASHEIGAVPYLINDGGNGLVYESGNIDMLYQKTKYLLDHPEEQERLGKAAYKTIVDEWNAEVAAERFIQLAEKLLKKEPVNHLFETGPCSPAEIISDKWNKR